MTTFSEEIVVPKNTHSRLWILGRHMPWVVGSVLLLFMCTAFSVHAVNVGPKIGPKPEVPPTEKKRPDSLGLPEIHAVVPILQAGYDPADMKLAEKGIWPEVRNTETIRSAVKIKEALIAINQFGTVRVVPDTSASADFYLYGTIKKSDGEDLHIEYQLIDATGKSHLKRTAKHRVQPGWHQRFGGPGIDPFQPVYDSIGNETWKVLKRLARSHQSKRKNSKKLSEVETISAVKDLALATYFNPSNYQKTLEVSNRNTYNIAYLPDRNSEDWTMIQRLALRDNMFLDNLNKHYEVFMGEVNPKYEEWQNEIYPTAREIRKARESETASNIVGGVLAVATIAAAVDADSSRERNQALAVGGALTSAALVKSAMDRHRKNDSLLVFNELSQSYHDTFKPVRIKVGNDVVTLEGTAVTQYNEWREILTDIYRQDQADIESIQIVE